MFVEVRSNLLSGESERFLLEDVSQVFFFFAGFGVPIFCLTFVHAIPFDATVCLIQRKKT